MTINIYNTLTRKKEEFVPLEPGKVKMYVCGPTVYNYIHIGNARPAIVYDTVRKYLEYSGYDVNFVSNFTDVDDKLIKAANELGEDVPTIADRFIQAYFEDVSALGCKKADYQMLRSASLKIISALDVVGGCNIQFALDPLSKEYFVIEVNPRVSRSSALASKATGYPIAKMAAKLAVGYTLDELKNPLTGTTYASFEPALDYVVVKFPRWPFDKFKQADRQLGTKMKATGEVMAIDRNLESAIQKAVASLEIKTKGFHLPELKDQSTEQLFER
ncbi:hypothetical protein [Bacillus subtilis]|uniref:ATP-binding protein n=1 Tax=Bacillus subtilis TaxID=1423 RepID=UPI0025462E59|nr:hypothetical protein [Bacillus subtilis]